MRHAILAGGMLALVVNGCAPRAEVPVMGSPEDRATLTGVWAGEYSSIDTGRSGDIFFRFEEGADSALGDVLMIPADQPEHEHAGGGHPASEFIDLLDVRVAGTRVAGHLAPYRDPRCGCRVRTEFEGTRNGDRIEGTFRSVHLEGGSVHQGRWWVERISDAR